MDDATKLSPKQLLGLLAALKGSKKDASLDPEALLSRLNDAQAETARQVLRDPQKLQSLLGQPQIRALLQQLQAELNADGTAGA